MTEPYNLTVDPGGNIGWCTWVPVPDPGLIKVVKWSETKQHQPFLDSVWNALEDQVVSSVVCEDFIPRAGVRTWQPDALHQIGALQWMCRHWSVPFILQLVGDAERMGTAKKLAPYLAIGYGRGGEGHAIMALKHSIYRRLLS